MQERIVDLDELDVVVIELPCEPLVAVDVHLNPKREPGLQLDVNETQVAVNEVVVQLQALALR